MHTILVISGGFVLLAIAVVLGRWIGGPGSVATAALYFLPVWLVCALINMWLGVSSAGYTVAQEVPIAAVVFVVPAAVAVFLWWRFARA
jgi:hypothetical protein